jgi:hypothetical protein
MLWIVAHYRNIFKEKANLMNDHTAVPAYRTLILRCWSEQSEVEPRRFWRFHLQWLDTQERQSFANLDELLVSLDSVFSPEDGPPTP